MGIFLFRPINLFPVYNSFAQVDIWLAQAVGVGQMYWFPPEKTDGINYRPLLPPVRL
jgi:hypothetical protein